MFPVKANNSTNPYRYLFYLISVISIKNWVHDSRVRYFVLKGKSNNRCYRSIFALFVQ